MMLQTQAAMLMRTMPMNHAYIKQRRERLNLTQPECAMIAGMTNAQKWSDVENGRNTNPTLGTLEGIAKALRCRVAKLITEK